MTALHVLTGEFLALANNEDLPADAIKDTLEAIQATVEEKAKALADWSLDMDGNILKIDAAIERLESKKKTLVAKKESLTEYIKTNMEASGITKITCPLFTITLVAPQDIVAISDEALVPDEFVSVKVVTTPDKKQSKKLLKMANLF
jgi:hypothetical protein